MKVVIVGAGGHARSVLDAVRRCGDHEVVGLTDPRPELRGQSVDAAPVLGDDSELVRLRSEGVTGAVVGVGAVGDNRRRGDLFNGLIELGFALPSIIHPGAIVAESAELRDGTVVLAGAVVGPGARVGRNVIVNTAAVVEHDCQIGDHAHLATACALGGNAIVGAFAHVGIGAAVRNAIEIGSGAVVGAGAAVVADVPADVTVFGVPARPRPED